MRALFWDGNNLRLETSYPTPEAIDAMALVRVRRAGICSTDLQIFKGYMGFRGVPGHEFVGEVLEGSNEWVEKRVVGEINFACGRCAFCVRGLGRHCGERKVMGIFGADGSFAEVVAVPVANLHVVPDNIDDDEAVFTEPLAAAFEILEQVVIGVGDDVLVLGDGKLGILCPQVLKLTGAHVCVMGKHPKKLDLVRRLGIGAYLFSDWRPRSVDLVVEATGSASGLKGALEMVRPRGTVVLKSTLAGEHTISLAQAVINEVTVVGSRCGLFPPALQTLADGSVQVGPLIEKVYPLSKGIDAVDHAARPGMLKVLLRN